MAKTADEIEEAGRAISAANAEKIRAALATLSSLLGDDDGASEPTGTVTEALSVLQLLEAELSSDEKSQAIRAAILEKLGGDRLDPAVYVWIQALYETSVIYEVSKGGGGFDGAELYRCDYTFAEDGTVTLGESTEVEKQTTYVVVNDGDVGESNASDDDAEIVESEIGGDIIPLVERALRSDGTIGVKIIAPGWGSKGYYSEALLRREGPSFFPVGTHMYWDHPKESDQKNHPERSLRDLAAQFTTGAVYEENGSDGPGLYARAKPVSTYAPIIEQIAEGIGTSIRALGRAKEGRVDGRTGKVVESFIPLRAGAPTSVDFVTAAGAGGKVTQLFESARSYTEPMAKTKKGEKPMSGEFDAKVLEEAQRASEAKITELEERLKRADEREMLREAEDIVRRELARAELHDLTRMRLAEGLIRNVPLTESGAVDHDKLTEQIRESVKQEVAYITSLTGGGRIRGMGPGTELGFSEDQVRLAESKLEDGFKRMGLSPEAAKVAAGGRR